MSDGVFFFLVFLFFFVVWLAGGGPSKPISFAGPYITPITGVGVNQYGYGSLPGGVSSAGNSGSAREQITTIQTSVTSLQQKVNDAQLFGDPSPHKGQVLISWGNNVGATDPKQEYIALKVSHDAPQNVTISGWKLQSVSNDTTVTIPQGVELFSQDNNNPAPVVLHPDDIAYVITGESPLGVSFRSNECMGYYTHGRQFVPSLSMSCPSPLDEYNKHYTGNPYKDTGCYNAVHNLNQCQLPPDTSYISNSCNQFFSQYLNYPGCLANHRGDDQFWGQWYLYLNRTAITKTHTDYRYYGELWQSSHDAIRLLDENGKTVDLYQY